MKILQIKFHIIHQNTICLIKIYKVDNEFFWFDLKYPDFLLLTNRVLEHTILKLQRRIFSLQFASAYQRYNDLLEQSPEIGQRVALKHIASYLGITLETLSRIRNPNYRI